MAFLVAEPADAGGQAFELDVLGGGVEPAVQGLVLGEELLERGVGDLDVLRVAGERDPAERAEAFAEEGADVGGHEAGEGEGAVVAGLARFVADRVAVVEHLGAAVLELDHRLHVLGHGLLGAQRELLRILVGLALPVLEADADGQVGQRVVGRSLVGDDVDLGGLGAVEDEREDLGGVADESDGERLTVLLRLDDLGQRGVEVGLDLVEVALGLTAVEAGLVDVDDEAGAAVEGDGQGLGPAHAAAAGGDRQGA